MSTITTLRKSEATGADEWQMRIDLAAAFRLAVRYNWHEAVANHFSLAVSADGSKFLMNPKWRHFSRIKASDLQLLDANDETTMSCPDAPDPSAWCIHGSIHAKVPQARCLLHVHPAYGTAIASLADPEIKPIDQNTARFFNRVVYDDHFGGIANLSEEGERLAGLMGERRIMMMGNHGVLVTGDSVAEAFDAFYYLTRLPDPGPGLFNWQAARCYVRQPGRTHRARLGELCRFGVSHFAEMKRILDDEDPSYAE